MALIYKDECHSLKKEKSSYCDSLVQIMYDESMRAASNSKNRFLEGLYYLNNESCLNNKDGFSCCLHLID